MASRTTTVAGLVLARWWQLSCNRGLGKNVLVGDWNVHLYDAKVAPGHFQCSAWTSKVHDCSCLITHDANQISSLNKEPGFVLSPKERWNIGYKFKIHGWSYSDCATNHNDCRGISDERVFVSGASITKQAIWPGNRTQDQYKNRTVRSRVRTLDLLN
jgi:hypothetical protein